MFRNIESKVMKMAFLCFVATYCGVLVVGLWIGSYGAVTTAAVIGFLIAWITCLPLFAVGERVEAARSALREATKAREKAAEIEEILCEYRDKLGSESK